MMMIMYLYVFALDMSGDGLFCYLLLKIDAVIPGETKMISIFGSLSTPAFVRTTQRLLKSDINRLGLNREEGEGGFQLGSKERGLLEKGLD